VVGAALIGAGPRVSSRLLSSIDVLVAPSMLVLVELPGTVVLVVEMSTRLTLVVEPLGALVLVAPSSTLVPVVAGVDEPVPRLELLAVVA
jgi:hypothetical protein